jgi:hypothetical protein
MGQSSLAGGSLNRASSRSSAARCLHNCLCFGHCFLWQSALQYLTSIHDLHALRLTTPPSLPHSAQQLVVMPITLTLPTPPTRTQSRRKSIAFSAFNTSFGRVDSRPKSYNFLCSPQPTYCESIISLTTWLPTDIHTSILFSLTWASRICEEFLILYAEWGSYISLKPQ